MKNLILAHFLTCFVIFSSSEIFSQVESEFVFNDKLAKKLNADDYGMKKYVMAFLKSGPNRSQDSITRAKLQREHLNNIIKMADDGILVMAGPFFGDGNIRGIYIFNVESIEEARTLTETDPLIKSGGLIMELHLWYGSAALQQIGEIHKTIAKKSP